MNVQEICEYIQTNREFLSSGLETKSSLFIDYINSSLPIVKVVSAEERLKSKIVTALADCGGINVIGETITDSSFSSDLFCTDYIILVVSALKIAPICLTEYLEQVKGLGKRCFVLVDNWEVIPKTTENINIITEEVNKEYSMLDVFQISMVSEHEAKGFSSLLSVVKIIVEKIERLYNETRNNQISKCYVSIKKEIEKERSEVALQARVCQGVLEELRNNLAGMEKANRIKFDNIRDVLNVYSVDLLDNLNLLSIDEYIEDKEDFSDFNVLKNAISSRYVESVKEILNKKNELSANEYKSRLEKYRSNILTEITSFYNRLSKIEKCDERSLDQFMETMKELDTVDDITDKVKKILDSGLDDLNKKISSISKRACADETLGDDNIFDKLKRITKLKENEEIDDEEERIKRERIIRQQLEKAIKNANLKVFEETDKFIATMKSEMLSLSNDVVVIYYSRLEKILLEMESQLEKKYSYR